MILKNLFHLSGKPRNVGEFVISEGSGQKSEVSWKKSLSEFHSLLTLCLGLRRCLAECCGPFDACFKDFAA